MATAGYPSPNFGDRRGGAVPDLIVIHYTAMASCAAARARLCDPESEVSAHYLISERGTCEALVPEAARAWHAGAGAWGPITDVNSRSIGIELANGGSEPFSEPQMAALERLLGDVMRRWRVAPQRVLAHSDIAPDRKCDPGRRFDWRRLARAGLSVWPEAGAFAATGAGDDFTACAAQFGYVAPSGTSDPQALLLEAFRQRFRPAATGSLDEVDRAMIRDLARRFPVDGGRGCA